MRATLEFYFGLSGLVAVIYSEMYEFVAVVYFGISGFVTVIYSGVTGLAFVIYSGLSEGSKIGLSGVHISSFPIALIDCGVTLLWEIHFRNSAFVVVINKCVTVLT